MSGTFGEPDDMVVKDGKIYIIEEAKMYSKADWNKMAKLDPYDIVHTGLEKKVGTDKRYLLIQIKKHRAAVEYLQKNLDKFPEAKDLGILHPNNEIRYILKAPSYAPDDALRVIQKAFEQYKTPIEIRKVQWGK